MLTDSTLLIMKRIIIKDKTYSGDTKVRLSLTFPLSEQPGEVFLISSIRTAWIYYRI